MFSISTLWFLFVKVQKFFLIKGFKQIIIMNRNAISCQWLGSMQVPQLCGFLLYTRVLAIYKFLVCVVRQGLKKNNFLKWTFTCIFKNRIWWWIPMYLSSNFNYQLMANFVLPVHCSPASQFPHLPLDNFEQILDIILFHPKIPQSVYDRDLKFFFKKLIFSNCSNFTFL